MRNSKKQLVNYMEKIVDLEKNLYVLKRMLSKTYLYF